MSGALQESIGDGNNTSFWRDPWVGDQPLRLMFPRLFVLEKEKKISVASKLGLPSVDASFCRQIRGGIESQQWNDLISVLDCIILSPAADRWICDLNGDGMFRVKDIRSSIDSIILLSDAINSVLCPMCGMATEDSSHVLFRCELDSLIIRKICRWWELDSQVFSSFADWDVWFSSIRLSTNSKLLLEGVFFVAWWNIWYFG
ncbi:hypothetical protein Tco_1182684 [Tanacetum coccineum]